MSATIMMPTQIESAIREMCTDAMSQAVAALAEKYGFDAEEANRFLSNSDVKIVRKRGPSPKKEKEGKKETKAKAEEAGLQFSNVIRKGKWVSARGHK